MEENAIFALPYFMSYHKITKPSLQVIGQSRRNQFFFFLPRVPFPLLSFFTNLLVFFLQSTIFLLTKSQNEPLIYENLKGFAILTRLFPDIRGKKLKDVIFSSLN